MEIPKTEQARWFAEEVHPHAGSLRSYLNGSFPAVRDVDDVVQESLLRVWKARMGRPIFSAKSFLFQVARHLAIDLIRHDRASPIEMIPDLAALSVMEDRPGVAEAACTNDELELLAGAFRALPARCREVMYLRQIAGLSQKEIAARCGISELTVQTQVVQGLRRCEAYLRKRGVIRHRP